MYGFSPSLHVLFLLLPSPFRSPPQVLLDKGMEARQLSQDAFLYGATASSSSSSSSISGIGSSSAGNPFSSTSSVSQLTDRRGAATAGKQRSAAASRISDEELMRIASLAELQVGGWVGGWWGE